MATIIINRNEYTIPEGEKLNAIQMAQRVGIDIPYYCWHPALSVVANCRMCEIEIGTKDPKTGEIKMVPKLVPACQTPAKDLTVLVTDSPKVKEHQQMIMEYLLLNHPLDCPVCDQAGECGLQDYSFRYGQSVHRFVEERAVNPRRRFGPLIQLNQDRCIMCTRCVRFTREISQTGELQVMRRGNHAEIDIFPGEPVDNPLAGNVVDLCPVGALLDKDFLHKQRAWFLSKHDSICTRCSTGCNVSAEENRGTLWRFKPRQNPFVNDYWICDEGRYSYKAANDPNLLRRCTSERKAIFGRRGRRGSEAVDQGFKEICQAGGLVAGLLSPFLTVEEAYLLASYFKGLNPANVLALGPVPSSGTDQTFRPDQTKGRTGDTSFVVPRPFTIHAEKCPNRRGLSAVLEHFEGKVIGYDDLVRRVASGEFRGLYAASDAIDPWIEEAESEALRAKMKFLVVEDTNVTPLAHLADVVLAGGDVRRESRLLRERRRAFAVFRGGTASAGRLAAGPGSAGDPLEPARGGPVDSSTVLAELAERIPAFGVAKGGKLPALGVVAGRPDSRPTAAAAGPPSFTDTWFLAHGVARGR